MEIAILAPNAKLLGAGVLLDLLVGDPVYGAHPVRLIGKTLTWIEDRLRAGGMDGYGGGIALFCILSLFWVGGAALALSFASALTPWLGVVLHVFLVYSLLALHDLLRHAWAVEQAVRRGDPEGAQAAISRLVGRDTSRMDIPACRRAAIESLSENLTDGFISPLFWYGIAGVPGLVLFKVVSTMDSMVGYKTPRYLRFGWCGARLDDLMNLIPARVTWLMISAVAAVYPGCSATKALLVGWSQHSILPGPNSGWSEAAIAGALQRRLIGPIWANGNLVTEVWVGCPTDPPAGEDRDMVRAAVLTVLTGIIGAGLTMWAVAACAAGAIWTR